MRGSCVRVICNFPGVHAAAYCVVFELLFPEKCVHACLCGSYVISLACEQCVRIVSVWMLNQRLLVQGHVFVYLLRAVVFH